MPDFKFQNKNIVYYDLGTGPVMVLIHGYLETKEVWRNISQSLAQKFRIIVPDIPGHGQSDVLAETHSMELMADAISALLDALKIQSATLVGHSMGGYIMLAFAQKYPEKTTAQVLFHSSIYADSEEKKQSRITDIKRIQLGYLNAIVDDHLPKTFAPNNESQFADAIVSAKKMGYQQNTNGVCALLRGMIERPDRQQLIQQSTMPLLFIFGNNDRFIPKEAADKMVALNPGIQTLWLENSGHMGFIEEPEKVLAGLINFIEKK